MLPYVTCFLCVEVIQNDAFYSFEQSPEEIHYHYRSLT